MNEKMISFLLLLFINLLFFSCNNEVLHFDKKNLDYNIDNIDSLFKVNKEKHTIEFVLRDTTWTFSINDIDSVIMNKKKDVKVPQCYYDKLNIDIACQSCIIINDTLIGFKTGGAATAISLVSKEKVDFSPECITYQPHCNVANCYDKNSKHYVYLSEWDGKHRCFVEELSYNPINKVWKSTTRQILSLNMDDSIRGKGNMDWIVDSKNDKIYVQTYKDGNSKNATGLIYLELPLPALDQIGEVVLSSNDIIRRIEHPMIYITQDKEIYKGKIYIASGLNDNYPGQITAIDLETFEDDIYDLSNIKGEPEGLAFYKNNLFLFYWATNYNIQKEKAINIYFRNGMCLSYPIEDIVDIKFY